MRFVALLGICVLLAACASEKETAPRVMVVDARGYPLQGVLVMPDSEDEGITNPNRLTGEERDRRTSDAQGLIHADLRVYYWPSDGCFHFLATKQGYADTTFSVSSELFPSPLRIKMDTAADAEKPEPTHKALASPTK